MSSDESRTTNSSRLSQFGLYRTIDARTEEFLRLSRKRQIRQGCACAAVSTAITVTVVVTVLLVYEYSVNSETNLDQKPIRKPNWINLFNDSSPFDAKYNKAKLNIDSTTLKLLPIILKALNHNRYLEKLIEDSSSSPTFDKKDTTEFSYQKNIFNDVKKMKIPVPKIYTLEYKNSPIIYFKDPKKNTEFYMKNRKIRDYQRILRYFNKMINDKDVVSISPIKYDGQTEKPPLKVYTTTMKSKPKHQKQDIKAKERQPTSLPSLPCTPPKISTSCKCPKNLGLLLSKLLTSIQDLLPEILIAKSPCHANVAVTTATAITTSISRASFTKITTPKSKTIINSISELTENPETTTAPKKQDVINFKNYLKRKKNTTLLSKSIDAQNKIMNDILKPAFERKTFHLNNYKDTNTYLKGITSNTTTTQPYLEPPNDEYLGVFATEPMLKSNDVVNQVPINELRKITEASTKHKSQISVSKGNDYTDILSTTEYEPNLFGFDIHDLEPIINDILPENKEDIDYSTTKSSAVDTANFNLFSLRKMGDLHIPGKVKTNKKINTTVTSTTKPKIYNMSSMSSHETNESIQKTTKNIETTTEGRSNNKNTTEISQETTTIFYPGTQSILESNQPNTNNLKFQEGILEDEENRIFAEDDIQDQEIMKQIDNIIKPRIDKYAPSPRFQITGTTIKTTIGEQIHKENKQTISKSMLPNSRPTYLEINRNDWKHNEHQDYDSNININLFDINNLDK